MTPAEYLKIEKEQEAIIEEARRKIVEARLLADECRPPANLRKAEADDIKPGAIIWHERDEEYGGYYWHVVLRPQCYGDPWEAYVADDGSRYGLDGAYVEDANVGDEGRA